MVRLFVAVILSCILQPGPLAAQSSTKVLAFNALTINDGLSQGMITRILQDKYGFMWFATLDGLNRYDGYRFTVYHHDAQDPSSITESFVQEIFEDSKGRLWVGTISGGVDLFDRATESFIHVKDGANGKPLSRGAVQSIAEDRHGNIWVQIGDKLDKILLDKNQDVTGNNFFIQHINLPFEADFSLLTITQKGHIYYVDATKGIVYRLNERMVNWKIALRLDDLTTRRNDQVNHRFRVVQLLEDKASGKLYLFHDVGVVRLNAETAAPEKIYYNNFFSNFDGPMRASIDSSGLLWYSRLNRLSFFDIHSGQGGRAIERDSIVNRTMEHMFSTFIDRSGLLWLGTTGYGLLKRNVRSENFHRTGYASDYSIKEADDGKILFGNNVSVRDIFDRATGLLTPVKQSALAHQDQAYFNKFLFPPIAQDHHAAWYVDTFTLRCDDKFLKKTIHYSYPVKASGEYELVQCKLKDSSGSIWLGTTDGLLRFRLSDRKWVVYTNQSNDKTSQSPNVIFSLCLDPLEPERYLWIGTRGSGLNRMDMNTGKCIIYTIKDGLPNDVIYAILPDNAGNLWISTNKGLSCFNPRNKIFRNFDFKDGLQSNEFNRGAYCRTKDGCLFFGGVSGFNYFYPQEILKNMAVPEIVITNLKIRNQPVLIGTAGSPLKEAIYLTKKLRLAYEQNFISLEFASMDYTNSNKNRYQYKLEGFEQNWINADNTHSATYTNLDPGSYTFRVKGTNSDGTWNEKGTSLDLVILPPWYMTWWFRTAMVFAMIGAAYSFYRYRLAQAVKLQAIRDRIAGDLHDEVGSNLSNILIFSNVAQQKATVKDENGPLLQKISDYTQQSMEAMDDIVWMINTRNDRFENILVRMRTLAAEVLETSGAQLHLDFDEELNSISLKMEDRKNFYLIYKEAINNITKYAACKNAWIELKLVQKRISLLIRDDGKGFDLAQPHKGNGLFNMKKRAALLDGELTIDSTVYEGTSILLTFRA